MAKIEFTIDDLYKTLRKHDKDILKHFEDESLSDKDYLFYAINSDIMSNTLSMVMNILNNNEGSIGIDNNARAIIESFVILKMLRCGAISDSQLKIFRNNYAIVEYLSFKKELENEKETKEYELVKKRYDDAISFMCNYYKCTIKDLKNNRLNDPLYYLRKTIDEDINFTKLLYKYPVFDEHNLLMYEFYSIMVHPRFEFDKKMEEGIQEQRRRSHRVILNYVVRHLENSKLIVIDKDANSFDDDFTNNELLRLNVENIKLLDTVFELIEEEFCYFENGYDGFSLFFYKNVNYLLKDMMTCELLGYSEQVINKFKSFMEMAAIYKEINSVDDLDEHYILKNAFICSSRLQLDEHFNSMNLGKDKLTCRELYDKYYKEKYNLNSYERFEKNMRENSLYFLSGNKTKNYREYVKKAVEDIFPNNKDKFMDIYDLSNRMNHASGYNFNSSNDLADIYSREAIRLICVFMINLLTHSFVVLENNNHKIKDFEFIKSFFQVLIINENQTMEEIVKHYKKHYN